MDKIKLNLGDVAAFLNHLQAAAKFAGEHDLRSSIQDVYAALDHESNPDEAERWAALANEEAAATTEYYEIIWEPTSPE